MSEERRSIMPLLIAGFVAVLLVAGTRMLVSGDAGGPSSDSAETVSREDVAADCPVLVAGVSSEKATLVSGMADSFNDAHASGENCAFTEVHSVPSGLASSALSEGWDEERMGFEEPDL